MLSPAELRGWGRASELAEAYGISRSLLYQIKDRVKEALEAALKPKPVGRPAEENLLRVDREMIRKAIAVMPVLTGSVRIIQTGLELLFGVQRSVGYISQTLQAAGQAADRKNEGMRVPLPVLGEADEIFSGRKPCLTVVDGRSFLVLNLAAAESRDAIPDSAGEASNWGLTFLDLVDQGVVFQDLAADGARGIRAGLRDAELTVPLRPDLFHLLRDGKKVQNRLEKAAYKAIRIAEKTVRAEREANQTTKRQGRPLKVDLTAAEACQQETQAITTYDNFCWLLAEVRQALEPITNFHRLQEPHQAWQALETAIDLIQSLPSKSIPDFAQQLQDHLDELLAPLHWLCETLAPWRKNLPADLEAWILASWRNGLQDLETIPTHWQKTAVAIWDALTLFHRSSSLAESLHSWLRPYLSIHRGMPDWLFPLLQLFWNHHVFSRGKRAGNSPLQLAGVKDPPSLANAFDNLFANPAAA